MPDRCPYDTNPVVPGTSRCENHGGKKWGTARPSPSSRGYDTQTNAQVVAEWRATHGDVCPGYRKPAHPSSDLTAAHILALSEGGTNHPSNFTVLCRSCNTAEAVSRANEKRRRV